MQKNPPIKKLHGVIEMTDARDSHVWHTWITGHRELTCVSGNTPSEAVAMLVDKHPDVIAAVLIAQMIDFGSGVTAEERDQFADSITRQIHNGLKIKPEELRLPQPA